MSPPTRLLQGRWRGIVRSMLKSLRLPVLVVALVVTGSNSFAQGVEFTVFVGRAYPVYDERLTFTPSLPVLPRVAVRESGPLTITTVGGPVFGAALAFHVGAFGVEGRVDATDVAFDVNGTAYDLVATAPTTATIGSVRLDAARLNVDRLHLLSLNVRLRTPGPVGLVASGGLSYLPGVTIQGTLPVTVEAAGILSPSTVNAQLRLVATPSEETHRWGLNGGAGIRIGGSRVALLAEGRVFYFRRFDLQLAGADGPDLLNAVATGIPAIHFEPVIVNAQVGVVFRF
jgi:hypothetical protein